MTMRKKHKQRWRAVSRESAFMEGDFTVLDLGKMKGYLLTHDQAVLLNFFAGGCKRHIPQRCRRVK